MWSKIFNNSRDMSLLVSDNSVGVSLQDGKIGFFLSDYQISEFARFVSGIVMPLDAWTDISISYTRHVGVSFYVNGHLNLFASTSQFAEAPFESSDYNLYFGSYRFANLELDGVLDEIKFYYKGLSAAGMMSLSLEFSLSKRATKKRVTKLRDQILYLTDNHNVFFL